MTDYFPDASFAGRIYNINGVLYLIRNPILITTLDGEEELGWDANNLSDNCSYHFFTESEIKENNYVIQEF